MMSLLQSMENHFFNTQIHNFVKTCIYKETIMYTYDEDISVKRAKQNWLWKVQYAREARGKMILAFAVGFGLGFTTASMLVWVATL